MRRVFVAVAALLIVVAPGRGSAASKEQRFVLLFGSLHLQPNERIVAIEITLTAARFAAINPIPNDWSVSIEGPIGQCTLKATCQHGGSALSRIQDLDSAITVAIWDRSSFTISATVHTSTDFEHSTEHKLTRSQLILRDV
jgi:hypothetical protein